ncbi:MAG TPA: glycosyltransferase family 4 protein [Actinomycetota bacterium]|nr:glycosyltransferase family 4 protein [Actinomycetota bacterium]
MRLAWFTPLPPMLSGIADYSSELLPLFAEAADVDVICPRPSLLRRAKAPPGIVIRPPERFRPDRYDAIYYHLGNNPWHEFVYETALRHPGICVFHDVVMHHLIAHAMVESGDQVARYERLLGVEHGDSGSRLARLKVLAVASDFEKFLFPLSGHLVRRAEGVVVHSLDSRDRLLAAAGNIDVPVEVIPHHAGAPPPQVAGIDRAEARRRLGLPQDAFLVGHLGFVTLPKQPGALVAGFAHLYRETPHAKLLVVGADNTGGAFERTARRHGVHGAVVSTGYVDLVAFYLNLKALDVVVNLRYPTAGESSGTFARALAEGRAAIVNNYGSFAEVPRDVALKVEVDGDQAAELGEHLVQLARDPALRTTLEANAREYARTVLNPLRCRDLYLAFAQTIRARPAAVTTERRSDPTT